MTLQEWIDNGGCMFSHYTTYSLCKHHDMNENQLRAMPLVDIFALRTIEGDMHEGKHLSQRELMRFWSVWCDRPDLLGQLSKNAIAFANAYLNA